MDTCRQTLALSRFGTAADKLRCNYVTGNRHQERPRMTREGAFTSFGSGGRRSHVQDPSNRTLKQHDVMDRKYRSKAAAFSDSLFVFPQPKPGTPQPWESRVWLSAIVKLFCSCCFTKLASLHLYALHGLVNRVVNMLANHLLAMQDLINYLYLANTGLFDRNCHSIEMEEDAIMLIKNIKLH